MQNVRDYLRFRKFFHHRVQCVVQPRNICFFVERKKSFFGYPGFSDFWGFPGKTGFLDFFRVRNVLKTRTAHILNQCNELYRLISDSANSGSCTLDPFGGAASPSCIYKTTTTTIYLSYIPKKKLGISLSG